MFADTHKTFNLHNSSSFGQIRQPISISYGPGIIRGFLGSDTVRVMWKKKLSQDRLWSDHCLQNRYRTSWQDRPTLTPIDIGLLPTGSCPWGDSLHSDTQTNGLANPERGLGCGLAAPLPMSSSGFILLGARRGGKKAATFIFSDCAGHCHGNNLLKPATTPHSRCIN